MSLYVLRQARLALSIVQQTFYSDWFPEALADLQLGATRVYWLQYQSDTCSASLHLLILSVIPVLHQVLYLTSAISLMPTLWHMHVRTYNDVYHPPNPPSGKIDFDCFAFWTMIQPDCRLIKRSSCHSPAHLVNHILELDGDCQKCTFHSINK